MSNGIGSVSGNGPFPFVLALAIPLLTVQRSDEHPDADADSDADIEYRTMVDSIHQYLQALITLLWLFKIVKWFLSLHILQSLLEHTDFIRNYVKNNALIINSLNRNSYASTLLGWLLPI